MTKVTSVLYAIMNIKYTISGCGLIALLAMPPVVKWLESSMAGQMLVQMPALILGGYWIGRGLDSFLPPRFTKMNDGGLPGFLLAVFVINFWLLPRSLDDAVAKPAMELAKFVSLPLFAGIPMALSWIKLNFISKGFVWANLVSMLLVMGWLYLVSPVRLCNNYLFEQQIILGKILLVLAGAIALIKIGNVFLIDHRNDTFGQEVRENER